MRTNIENAKGTSAKGRFVNETVAVGKVIWDQRYASATSEVSVGRAFLG
jgi:hypothetical protein